METLLACLVFLLQHHTGAVEAHAAIQRALLPFSQTLLAIANELNGNRPTLGVRSEQKRPPIQTRCGADASVECGGALCGMCVSEAVCRALCSRGLFYVAVCPVYVLLPLLCALH